MNNRKLKYKLLTSACLLGMAYTTSALAQSQYCTANGGNTYEWIDSVSIDGYTNTSGGQGRDNGLDGYSDFTSQTVSLTQGTVSLTPGFRAGAYPEYWTIWIDTNQNGEFEQNEKVLSNLSGNGAVTGNINVPTVTQPTTTRMRIAMKYNSEATQACGGIGSGEVEDYTVFIDNDGGDPTPTNMPDACQNNPPFEGRNLVDGQAVCMPATSKHASFSIPNSNEYDSIAISTSHGIGNLTLAAKNGGGFPQAGDDSPRSKHVGNSECVIINNPSDYWTNVIARGLFKDASIVADLGATSCRVTPGEVDNGNEGYAFDSVNVVVYQFSFNDTPLEWSLDQIQQDMATVKQYYDEQSYGRFNVTWDIKPPIFINESKSVYDRDTPAWRDLFRSRIRSSGVDPDFPGEATIILMAAPQVANLNSQAGPPLMEIYHHAPGTIAHEMGHALGLRHSMAVEAGNSILRSNNDTITNYGNVYAMMGMGAHTLEEYNLMFKSYFNWIRDSEVPVVSTSGVYRIHAFDHGTAAGTNAPGEIGIRLKSGDGNLTYWLEYRTTNPRYPNTKNGILVNLQGYLENEADPAFWNHRSAMLDMNPNSQSTANWNLEDQTDSELEIGKSFTDPWGGFRITLIAKGGAEDTASAWIDVRVEMF
ncbi:collagenase [Alteromonadaceae bacterium M269]|nr:collagenase [Alteromonadaceae bacterium M269]